MSALSAPANKPGDMLILVDGQDRETGFLSKEECHRGQGTLHRAFSVFLFDRNGRLLLQQRSAQKPLWPLYWSNSCCSHPRRGETAESAAVRRVREELGVTCSLQFLYKFEYQAQFAEVGAEHELCWVFAGAADGAIRVDDTEIAAVRFVSPADLTREIAADGTRFTPWLKLEWARIEAEFLPGILAPLQVGPMVLRE
jgi:isopentenyl-diphosphate delta-isomerase